MRPFFDPSSVAVFGVEASPRNLAKNIVSNCLDMGFPGEIYPVGRRPGTVSGKEILTDPADLPGGIELAVILVPAKVVPGIMAACGRKGIRHAIVSTAGYRELNEAGNPAERDLVAAAKRHGIRFIGPNCIGVICTESGLCTPFNPMAPQRFKKGPVSIIAQSGGVTTQTAYHFSEEHVGFSKIISVGNKLNITEVEFMEYLMKDPHTGQIHLYLESIEDGRRLMDLARRSPKPVVVFKSNRTRTASRVAWSHTAALSNDDRVVDGAFRQAGVVRVRDIHEMTVCAKALQLPPLKGDRLVAMSMSGGFSVVLGDACEENRFVCPDLPRELLDEIEKFRRAGVIRMGNPMDFGDVHDIRALLFTVKRCLALEEIDGMVLSFLYDPEIARIFGRDIGRPEQILARLTQLCETAGKPIAFSLMCRRQYVEEFKRIGTFPVFNDAAESVAGLRMLREYTRGRGGS